MLQRNVYRNSLYEKNGLQQSIVLNVVNEYEQTSFIDEALHRLVELHYKLGLLEESQKYASLLGYNYQSSEWYLKVIKFLIKIINLN